MIAAVLLRLRLGSGCAVVLPAVFVDVSSNEESRGNLVAVNSGAFVASARRELVVAAWWDAAEPGRSREFDAGSVGTSAERNGSLWSVERWVGASNFLWKAGGLPRFKSNTGILIPLFRSFPYCPGS